MAKESFFEQLFERSCFDEKLKLIQEQFKDFFKERNLTDFIITSHSSKTIGLVNIDESLPENIKSLVEKAFFECYESK